MTPKKLQEPKFQIDLGQYSDIVSLLSVAEFSVIILEEKRDRLIQELKSLKQ